MIGPDLSDLVAIILRAMRPELDDVPKKIKRTVKSRDRMTAIKLANFPICTKKNFLSYHV